MLCLARAHAQEEASPQPSVERIGGAPWSEWSRMTGDWQGWRSALVERGIEFGGGYIADWSDVLDGGVRRRDTYRSLTDVNVAWDLDVAFGWSGATVFVDAYSQAGRDGSKDAGDLQAYSNIDADNVAEIAELWFEQRHANGLRWKLGKVDANSEFNFIESAGEFIHSSAGFTPTIAAFPSYPDPATSVNVFLEGDRTYFGAGLYDGAAADGVPTGRRGPRTFFSDDRSDSWFTIAELGRQWTGGGDWGSGRAAIGAWHHSADFARFDGGTESGTAGLYVLFEQRLTREARDVEDDAQGCSAFVGYSWADRAIAEISQHAMAGVTYTGWFADRDADVVGLMVSHAKTSDDPAAGFAHDETAFELFYRIQCTGFFSIKPDLQYIVHPSGDASIDDALVASVRFEVTF